MAALIEGRWFLVVDGKVMTPVYGEISERAFVATIDETFWSPALHGISPGISLLVADAYVRFTNVDGRSIDATVLELTPGSHSIMLDFYSEFGGRALDVDLKVEIPAPGIYMIASEFRQYGLGKQLTHILSDAPENLLSPFVKTRTVGEVSFGGWDVGGLPQNYMTALVLSERNERQILGLLRQKWRPVEVRRVAAGVAADMLAEGRLDRDRGVPVLAEVVSDQADDRDLRLTIWKKLVELKLADAVREVPPDLLKEVLTPPGPGEDN